MPAMPAMPAILKPVGNSSKLSLKSHLYIVLIAIEENNGPGHCSYPHHPLYLTPVTLVNPMTQTPRSPR